MHRLEEMKVWQKEQQSKLLNGQQQEEKDFLEAQKKQILNLLSLNERNHSPNLEDGSSMDSKVLDYSQTSEEILNFNPSTNYDSEESRKNRIKYLEALLNECYHKKALLEEMPISSSGQDYEKLLEMSLSQNKENNPYEEQEAQLEMINSKPKKPFLRRGEGLARFNMTPEDFKKPVKMNFYRTRSHAALRNTQSSVTTSNKRSTPVRSKPPPPQKSRQSTTTTVFKNARMQPSILKSSQSAPTTSCTKTAQKMNALSSILKKPTNPPVLSQRENQSSSVPCDEYKQKKKEEKELRVFEILEEKVGEASFCSTSSTIAQLMDDSVKVTPSKENNDINQRREGTVVNHPGGEKVASKQNLQYPEAELNDDTEVGDDDGWTDISSDEESGETDKASFSSDDGERLCSPPPNFQKHAHFNDDIIYQRASAPCLPTSKEDPPLKSALRPSASLPSQDAALPKTSGTRPQSSALNSITQKDFEDLGLKFQPENLLQNLMKDQSSLYEKYNPLKKQADCTNFKTELLQQRLEDLEKELQVFRKENAKLLQQKQELESERATFKKQKREFETRVKKFHEEDEARLAEERKKLQKERLVFERYTKEVRSKPSKQEQEEIKMLKNEVAELKKELERKEGKWGSTLARLRNQMKVMEKDNNHLKEEVITLQKGSAQKQLISKGVKLADGMMNTKIIHAINKQLSNLTPEDIEELLDKREQILKKPQIINKPSNLKTVKKRRESTLKNCKDPEKVQKRVQINIQNESDTPDSDDKDPILEAVRKPVLKAVYPEEDVVLKQYEDDFFTKKDTSPLRQTFESKVEGDIIDCISVDGNREKIYPDGRKEIWLPNGNVKKISPDGNLIKIIYYNGDVKEMVVAENLTKYYYAASKTWHTTYGDGLEILEFSNGQVEKRLTDGTVEISFPNGSSRKIFPDGLEEWTFSDKSVLKTNKKTGYRMLELPNGQKEIHTSEYKKREFADGTVKLVYPDGTQETRYANGRIRLKDKNGKLIMDSDVKLA
nr:PREDICTED: centromere protein J [Bemisia tabaci]XP_018916384.1 PREDICTED: centromere protein J [Bemisia tabaci]